MACLSLAQTAIDSAKSAVDGAKATYLSELDSLKNLNPADFASRVDFEAAKAAATTAVQARLNSYLSAIDGLRSAGDLLGKLSGSAMDNIANIQELLSGDIVGLIPGGPTVPGRAAILKAAQQGLQC